MNIPERTDMCDITIQGYRRLSGDINIALDDSSDFNYSSICIEKSAPKGFSSIGLERPLYQNIQIKSDVVSPDA